MVDESSEGCAYIVFVGFAYFYVAYTEGCVSGYALCGEESEAIDGRGLYGKALRQGSVHLGDGGGMVVVGAFFYGQVGVFLELGYLFIEAALIEGVFAA